MSTFRHITLSVLVVFLLPLALSSVIQAQELCTQTCYVDGVNGTPEGDGLTPETAFQTIQRGIDQVNAEGGEVVVSAGIYNEAVSIRDKALTLTGAGINQTIIIPPPNVNAVSVAGTSAGVTINDLTVQNATMDGIDNKSVTLTLNRVHITQNGELGIQTTGSLIINDSIINANVETGIFFGPNITGTITGSTIANNGVDGITSSSPLDVTNSTFSGNGVDAVKLGMNATATLTHTTLVGMNTINNGTFTLVNSLVQGTCSTTLATVTNTVVTSESCGGANGATLVSLAEIGITPLANNGGTTPTHALSATSPAIDAATCTQINVDQREVSRPQGNACDAGAYEWQPASISLTVAPDPVNTPALFGLTGALGEVQLGSGETTSTTGLAPGTYTITPTVPAMWQITSLTCDINTHTFDGVTLSVTLVEGQSANCTLDVVYPFGNITVIKQPIPPAVWLDFGFSLTNGVDIFETFTLNGGDEEPDDRRTFTDLPIGTYTISEEDYPDNWILREISCDVSQTINGDSVTVTLTPGADITCVFDNARRGQIEITKYHDLNNDGERDADEPTLPGWRMRLFQQQPDETFVQIQPRLVETGENGTAAYTNLVPGVYQVCEVPQTGWLNTNNNTIYRAQDGLVCQQIEVDYAENVQVSFGNSTTTTDACNAFNVLSFTQGTTLGGDPVPDSRSNPNAALGAPQDDDTLNFVSLGFGGILVLQLDGIVNDGEGDDLYIFETSFDSATSEAVTVFAAQIPGDWVQLGTLTGDGGVDFAGIIDQVGYIALIDASDPAAFDDNFADGYDLDGIRCETPQGTLSVTKQIEWSYAAPFETGFEICITGTSFPNGDCQTVTADNQTVSWTVERGTYTVTESDPGARWQVDGSGVTLDVDEDATTTHTITNTYIPPQGTINVTKQIDWGDSEPFEVDFEICITGESFPNGDCQSVTENNQTVSWTVNVSTYTVTESDAGERWAVDGSDVMLTVTEDTTTTHTITNSYIPPPPLGQLRVTKRIDWAGGRPIEDTFTICITGPSYPDGACHLVWNDGDVVFWDVLPGEYVVTEQASAERWIITGNNGIATVLPNETTDYTITNTYIPPPQGDIQVTKRIDWNGGNPFPVEFTICISGPTYPDGSCLVVANDGDVLTWTVDVGVYTITEVYPGTDWTVTGNQQQVTIVGGDVVTHTITNSYIPPPPEPEVPEEPEEPTPPPVVDLCPTGPMMDHLSGDLQIVGAEGVGVITNTSTYTCTYQVGLASYTMPNYDLYWQDLFAADVRIVTLAPGESVEMRVALPDCSTQVDLFFGDVIAPRLGHNRYGPRLFAATLVNEANWCPPPADMQTSG